MTIEKKMLIDACYNTFVVEVTQKEAPSMTSDFIHLIMIMIIISITVISFLSP